MKTKLAICVILLFFLIACTPQAILTPSPTIPATASVTPSLQATGILQPTPSSTETPINIPTGYPTTPAQATQWTMIEKYCDGISHYELSFSKTRKFMAFVCWPSDEKDISITKVISLDNSHAPIEISYRKDYLGLDYSEPLPSYIQDLNEISRFSLYPVHWTADDKFLYLEQYSPVSGVQYQLALALMRLNIETGKLTHALPPNSIYYYDFSNDGTKLLSVDQTTMIVKVTGLVTGQEVSIQLDKRFDQAGYLLLSPDSTSLVISTIDNEAGISMILANLPSGTQEYLAKDIRGDFFPMSWLDDHTIYGWSYENDDRSSFYLDINTKQISPAPSPTLIPTSTP